MFTSTEYSDTDVDAGGWSPTAVESVSLAGAGKRTEAPVDDNVFAVQLSFRPRSLDGRP